MWLAVSHGDVIKAILADALGMHLDAFQRIMVDPASLSVVRYTPHRAFVDDHELHLRVPGAPDKPRPAKGQTRASRAEDAVVGGGAGPAPVTASRNV